MLWLASEMMSTKQSIFFFLMNNFPLVKLTLTGYLLKRLLEQRRLIRRWGGHGNHATDYTESDDKSRHKKLRRPVAPQIEPLSNRLSISLAKFLPE
jgi:hypothetical protein